MKRLLAAILGATLLTSLGCGGGSRQGASSPTPASPSTEAPHRGGDVVIGTLSDIQNWNPYLTETALADDVLALLYPTLAVEQVDYREHPPSFKPNLASSWELSADGLSLTFHLRRNAVWSDGVPVTSDDVVYSYRVRTSPEVGWEVEALAEKISSVEAVDEHTVRFRFTHRYPYQLMDVNDGPIIPAHAWRSIPVARWERVDWRKHALSAGPFRLLSSTPQQGFVLVRNERFWDPKLPYLDRVVWRVVPDQVNLLNQLRTGEIDFMQGIPPREAEAVRADPRLQLIHFADRTYGYLGWNTRNPLFRDPRVRRALTMAIDRQSILDSVMRGFARPAVGPVLSTMWAFNRNLRPLPYDLDRARRLLAEAGWLDSDGDGALDRAGKPFAFELITNAGNEIREDICQMVSDQLSRVGIRVTPRFIEWGTMLSRLEHGTFDAYVSAWREGTQVDLAPVWHSAKPGEATYNYVGYADPEVDRLIDQLRKRESFTDQKPDLDRIQVIIHRDQPYTFLYQGERVDGLNKRVKNAVINDGTPYFNLDEWYVVSSPR